MCEISSNFYVFFLFVPWDFCLSRPLNVPGIGLFKNWENCCICIQDSVVMLQLSAELQEHWDLQHRELSLRYFVVFLDLCFIYSPGFPSWEAFNVPEIGCIRHVVESYLRTRFVSCGAVISWTARTRDLLLRELSVWYFVVFLDLCFICSWCFPSWEAFIVLWIGCFQHLHTRFVMWQLSAELQENFTAPCGKGLKFSRFSWSLLHLFTAISGRRLNVPEIRWFQQIEKKMYLHSGIASYVAVISSTSRTQTFAASCHRCAKFCHLSRSLVQYFIGISVWGSF